MLERSSRPLSPGNMGGALLSGDEGTITWFVIYGYLLRFGIDAVIPGGAMGCDVQLQRFFERC